MEYRKRFTWYIHLVNNQIDVYTIETLNKGEYEETIKLKGCFPLNKDLTIQGVTYNTANIIKIDVLIKDLDDDV